MASWGSIEGRGVFTRRDVLKIGGGAGLMLAAGPASALAQTVTGGSAPSYARSSYTPLVGQLFPLKGTGYSARLTAIKDLADAPAGSNDAFQLLFSVPRQLTLATGTVPTISHQGVGSVPMFFTPGTASDGRHTLAAVINRLNG